MFTFFKITQNGAQEFFLRAILRRFSNHILFAVGTTTAGTGSTTGRTIAPALPCCTANTFCTAFLGFVNIPGGRTANQDQNQNHNEICHNATPSFRGFFFFRAYSACRPALAL